jgi:hypothetical protein
LAVFSFKNASAGSSITGPPPVSDSANIMVQSRFVCVLVAERENKCQHWR